jgi:hypothetical protein
LRQPTLVLMGRDDPLVPIVNGRILAHLIPKARPLVPIVNGRILAHLIPKARLEIIDDGHLFMVTQPKETAERIEDSGAYREIFVRGSVTRVPIETWSRFIDGSWLGVLRNPVATLRGGILNGIRGPYGGYELAREPHSVTIQDILRAAINAHEAGEELDSEIVAKVVLPVLSVAAGIRTGAEPYKSGRHDAACGHPRTRKQKRRATQRPMRPLVQSVACVIYGICIERR